MTGRRLSDDERAAQVAALTDKLHGSVTELTNGETWTRMLTTADRFHRYSARNMLLLLIQAEERKLEISRVAGYRAWQALGRQVRKGEKSFDVLAPIRRQLSPEEAAERAGKGERAYDSDGRPVKVVRGFRVEHVFDVSQTEGEPLAAPPAVPYLVGDGPEGLWDAIAELITDAGYEVIRKALPSGVRGETAYEDRMVTVAEHLGPAEAAHILTHELGHIEADHEGRREISRAQQETEADSIAYVVCSALGLDLGEKSTFYVAQWSKGDAEVLEAAVEVIHRAAKAILGRLEAPAEAETNSDAA